MRAMCDLHLLPDSGAAGAGGHYWSARDRLCAVEWIRVNPEPVE